MIDIKVTNMVKFYTLSLLATSPRHGYELIKELEKKLGREISASNVYPFLNHLKRKHFIIIRKRGNREKKVYELSKEGKDFTKQMFNKFGDIITIAIKPKLTICMQCGCKIYEGGHTEKMKGKLLKFCCKYCARSYKSNNK